MVTPDREKSNSSTVHSVVVTVKLLEFLATSGRPQRVTDIANSLKMTKARVSRHLSTLTDLGLVARLPDVPAWAHPVPTFHGGARSVRDH